VGETNDPKSSIVVYVSPIYYVCPHIHEGIEEEAEKQEERQEEEH
jgi:hypothetical protein